MPLSPSSGVFFSCCTVDQIAEEERTRLLPQLLAGSPHVKAKGAELFYKVPFEEALELVQGRRVYVHDGFAYVPATDVITLVMGVFRARLSAALTVRPQALRVCASTL